MSATKMAAEIRRSLQRNSVLGDDFKLKTVGTEVTFVEEAGERGPQASSVVLVGKHHRHKSVKEVEF